MDRPLVSICIPNYNNAKYLGACIGSALDIDYPNTEVVLVDDCSTDDSVSVVQDFATRIRLFQNPANLGQPRNTNRCVELSLGEYVVILHSDDLLLPGFADALVPILEAHQEVGMAAGERMVTDETGDPRGIAPFYDDDCVIPGEQQAKVFMMAAFLPCQVLVRRAILDKIGGVDERYVANLDGLLWFKCALQGDVGYTRKPVSVYRSHGESTTAHFNKSVDHISECERTLLKMLQLAKDSPYLESHFAAATRRIGHLALRFSRSAIQSGDAALVRKNLERAIEFDPELVNDEAYQALRKWTEIDRTDHDELYQRALSALPRERSFSYRPPAEAVSLTEANRFAPWQSNAASR